VSKTIEELVKIADRLMLACPRRIGDERPLTAEEDAQLAEIAGPLTEEDFKRLYTVFLVRHMPAEAKAILSQ
jgi:hypothetical protein